MAGSADAMSRVAGSADARIAALASRQRGLVSARQLLELGLSRTMIETRVRRHGLHRIHRGVYAVGHRAPVPGGREMAAVLACGPGTAVSHRSAAVLLRLLRDNGGPIEVTVRTQRRNRPGLVIHRSRTLRDRDVRPLDGIPTTTPTRTLLDFADTATDRELERAMQEALVQKLTSSSDLVAAVESAPGRRGAMRLTAVLDADTPRAFTRSEAEERFLALVRRAGLDAPQVNVELHGFVVDFLWPASRLVVEVDGYLFHSSRAAFERDRLRDARLGDLGYRVRRVTWRQLTEEPLATVAGLARALAAAGGRGTIAA